jgi:tetratricopeptide (TPR) repeat protein
MQDRRSSARNGRYVLNLKSLSRFGALLCLTLPMFAQDAPNSSQPAPAKAIAAPAPKMSIDQVNAALTAARAANREKRFEDAESLMLQATAAKPELCLPWLELGQAQLGLKKYAEAEVTYKKALGFDPAGQKQDHSADFFQAGEAQTHLSGNLAAATVVVSPERTPEVQGIGLSSLGEIYIHTGRIPEAQAAYDQAAKVDPKNAAAFRRNETIIFFQTGNSNAQTDAAIKAIALDPNRASLYYFKAQGLTSQATIDPKTQKVVLPPGCAEAYRKYLALEPSGQFANDAKAVLGSVQ